MATRAKLTLTPEQEILLFTLYAKAQPSNPLFIDPSAQDIQNRVDDGFPPACPPKDRCSGLPAGKEAGCLT